MQTTKLPSPLTTVYKYDLSTIIALEYTNSITIINILHPTTRQLGDLDFHRDPTIPHLCTLLLLTYALGFLAQ